MRFPLGHDIGEIFGVTIVGNKIDIAHIETGGMPGALPNLFLQNLVQDVVSNRLPLKSLDFWKNAAFDAMGNGLDTSVRQDIRCIRLGL